MSGRGGVGAGVAVGLTVDPQEKDIPISRAVGRFFGHLWQAAAKPVKPTRPTKTTHTMRTSTEETPGEVDGQRVILRRTTIEEVEFREPPEK